MKEIIQNHYPSISGPTEVAATLKIRVVNALSERHRSDRELMRNNIAPVQCKQIINAAAIDLELHTGD